MSWSQLLKRWWRHVLALLAILAAAFVFLAWKSSGDTRVLLLTTSFFLAEAGVFLALFGWLNGRKKFPFRGSPLTPLTSLIAAFFLCVILWGAWVWLLSPLFPTDELGTRVGVVAFALVELILLLCAMFFRRLVLRRRLRWAVSIGLIVAVAVGFVQFISHREFVTFDPETSRTSPFRVAVLGDSYISGEGAGTHGYFKQTDTDKPRNRCHQAPEAYPRLIAKDHDWGFTSLACSGARTFNVTADARNSKPQYPNSDPEVPGAMTQVEQLRIYSYVPDPEIVLVSVGGNDAGFADLARRCLAKDSCLGKGVHPYLKRLRDVIPQALERTYLEVLDAATKAVRPEADPYPSVGVFALTYPDPFGADCRVHGMNHDEVVWIRTTFLPELNKTITRAATEVGLKVIPMTDALEGAGICNRGSKAGINLLTVGHEKGSFVRYAMRDTGALLTATFHPSAYGHELMRVPAEKAIAEYLEGRPERGPEIEPGPLPPDQPDDEATQPDNALDPFPQGTGCDGTQFRDSRVVSVDEDHEEFLIPDVAPKSTVCFGYGGGIWDTGKTDSKGSFKVRLASSRQGASVTQIIVKEKLTQSWASIKVIRAPNTLRLGSPTTKAALEGIQERTLTEPGSSGRFWGAAISSLLTFLAVLLIVMGAATFRWVSMREDLKI